MLALMQVMSTGGSETDVGDMQPISIAVDGGMFANYAAFQRHIKEAFVEVLGSSRASLVRLELIYDGSGDGAALMAATAATSS